MLLMAVHTLLAFWVATAASTPSSAAGSLTTPPPLPDGWKAAIAKGDLLYSTSAAHPTKLLPSVENGFMGGDVECSGGAGGSSGTLHVSGIYSYSNNRARPDTRATFPNPLVALLGAPKQPRQWDSSSNASASLPLCSSAGSPICSCGKPGKGVCYSCHACNTCTGCAHCSKCMCDKPGGVGCETPPSPSPSPSPSPPPSPPSPSPAPAPSPPSQSLSFLDSGLDLRRAIYTSRWLLPAACGPSAVLSTSTYAHRKHRQLLVMEHTATGVTSKCSYTIQSCKGNAGGVSSAPAPGQPAVTLYTVTAEEQSGNITAPRIAATVSAMASDALPSTVTLQPSTTATPATPSTPAEHQMDNDGNDEGSNSLNQSAAKNMRSSSSSSSSSSSTNSLLLLAVLRTTIEAGVTSSTVAQLAAQDLAAFKAAGAATLAQDHVAAWEDVWGLVAGSAGGGIEVVGNASLAAQINSSMYYLLSSVRSDWSWGVSEGGLGSDAYYGHMFWSDAIMDGPLFAAINAPIADSLLKYRELRLDAAKTIAKLNNYSGAYWPWQSAATGFEQSCGNTSIASAMNSKGLRVGCYWMHEIHIGVDIAMYFRMNWRRKGNITWLREDAWPLVAATADFFASRMERRKPAAATAAAAATPQGRLPDGSTNYTLRNVIGPDEHSYIQDSNTYTNYAAGQTLAFAAEVAAILTANRNRSSGTSTSGGGGTHHAPPLTPPPTNVADWKAKAAAMYVPLQKYCLSWYNASIVGCPPDQIREIHPQYEGYHGQDINQADVALMQWPLHAQLDPVVAAADLEYYAKRSSGSDTKGFYTGDSSYSIAFLFANQPEPAAQQYALAQNHMLGPFNIWTELDPTVASGHGTGNLNFLTGAGGFLENMVFGYVGVHYAEHGLLISPTLPKFGVEGIVLRGLSFRGGTVRVEVNSTHMQLSRSSAGSSTLYIDLPNTKGITMATAPASTVLPRQQARIWN